MKILFNVGCWCILLAYLAYFGTYIDFTCNYFPVNSDTMFSVDEFFNEPQSKLSTIVYATKSQLLILAAKYHLEVRRSETKDDIKNNILQHCVDEDLITRETAQDFIIKENKDVEYMKLALELEKLKIDAEREKRVADREAEERRIALERKAEKEKREEERQAEKERREAELDLYRNKLIMDKQMGEQKLLLEKARLDHEASLAQNLEHEKVRLSLDNKKKMLDLESSQPAVFDLTKCLKLVPEFNEIEVDVFFRNFEDIAVNMQWPNDKWVWLIKSKVKGRAAVIVSHLSGESDYEEVKQAILDGYAITVEGHRQRFRQYYKGSSQTWYEFAQEKLRLFKKWLNAAAITDFDALVNLIVTEEFMRKLPLNIKAYIADKEELELKKVSMLADNYALIHKAFKGTERLVKQGKATKVNDEKEYLPFCFYCKKSGHDISECKAPGCMKSKFNSQTRFSESGKRDSSQNKPAAKEALHCYSENEDLLSDYISEGTVTLQNGDEPVRVRILRDSACTQSLIVRKAVPNISVLDENALVPIRDLSGVNLCPLANLNLKCKDVNGNVKIAVLDKDLPVSDVHILLGNDLARKSPFPNLVVYNKPVAEEPFDVFKNVFIEDVNSCVPDPEQVVNVTTRSRHKPDEKEENPKINLNIPSSVDQLIALQKGDETLSQAIKQAASKGDKVPGYYFNNGLLYRLYRSRKLSNNNSWANVEQLVVPVSLRQDILSVAHQSNSHLGITKTYQRIINEFFWPGLKKDVVNFVNQCHICQVSGKPNEVIPKAPLIPIVVPHEPFTKVIIDCVGPLPKTKKGNQYMLTAMCPTTRYPMAVPLRNISAKTVISQLLKIFTTYGFPREIQSDRGTNFTSNLFSQTLREFNIKHTLASSYHPESQGALERHHQTLKSLLKKFCVETGNCWDEGLDMLLFVLREVPNESLGVSPYEMLFGRKCRGPLQILKEQLVNKEICEVNISQYLGNLKAQLENIHSFAQNNLSVSQEVMKSTFDKGTKVRKFKVGDQVLVYFPTSTAPLTHKFSGPYTIMKCMNNNNYVISTPDRRKSSQLVHVNLLKKYHQPFAKPVALHCTSDSNVIRYKKLPKSAFVYLDDEVSNLISTTPDTNNSAVIDQITDYFQHLTPDRRSQLQELLNEHKAVCADEPGICKTAEHDVELLPNTPPIRQQYYRVGPEKLRLMKEEVAYLLRNGLAKPSSSPWASPCILVPKPNGKVRLCTDFRKVNSVTIKDSYPLPRIDDIIDAVGNAKFLTQIDLVKGYYQIPLTKRAKLISAFVTPFGLFEYTRLPFGMCNAPATFQRVVNEAIQGLEGIYAYLDDILIVSDTWEEHLCRLRALLARLEEMGFTINLAKSSFCQAQVRYLGHIIGSGKILPKAENIDAIVNYPVPKDRKSLLRFLGMTSYYRKFCKNFSTIACPLTELTSTKRKFVWTETCQLAFEQLKNILCSKPVLSVPDLAKPFSIQVDACDSGVGAVLMQENAETKELHPVSYYSYKLKPHQRSYATVEKELLGIIMTLQKYEVYFSTHLPVTIYTDHNPLTFLNRARLTNQRILRWSLYLQNFNIILHYLKGAENTLADALSRVYT